MILWASCAAADVPEDDAWLSAAEAATLARQTAPKRRADYRLGRWAARLALAAWPGAPRGAWSVRAREDGSPEPLLEQRPYPLCLSLSHAAGLAFASLAREDVALGCDVETNEPRAEALPALFFTDAEQRRLGTSPAVRAAHVALIWSAKESALKALRVGLRADTREVEITWSEAPGAGAWRPLEARVGGRALRGAYRFDATTVWTIVAEPWSEPIGAGAAALPSGA